MWRRVQATDAVVSFRARRRLGFCIEKPADQMPQRMAAKSVHGRAKSAFKISTMVPTPMPKCSLPVASVNHIPSHASWARIKMNKRRHIKKVAVDVLEDERKISFAQITFARLADGAVDRVGPKRLVICAAIIIAGETKSAGRPQDQKRRRKHQPRRPPVRSRPQNRVRRAAENFRREKRREIIRAVAAEPVGAIAVVERMKCRPSRINDERGKTEKHKSGCTHQAVGTG